MSIQANDVIEAFNLVPLEPEGGYFFQNYKSQDVQKIEHLGQPRSLGTSIYYLLKGDQISTFHRLQSDELWNFLEGAPLKLIEICLDGELKETILGRNWGEGEVYQALIPKGHWFGARPLAGPDYSLISCQVFPGFEYEDFEIGHREQLLSQFPQHRKVIEELCPIEN